MSEQQDLIDQWIKEFGVRYFSETTNMILLYEELGELSRYMARVYGEQSFKKKEDKENAKEKIREEMADVLFVLICLANQMGINLDEALRQSIHKKTTRDRYRHVNNEKLK